MRPFDERAPLREIVGFRQDDVGHWIAVLACGHGQHVRHEPPLASRPWTLTEEGRRARLGEHLHCMHCLAADADAEADADAGRSERP